MLRQVSYQASIVIHVRDGSEEMAVRHQAIPDEGSRGLMLVENLGQDWGSYRKADGKTVWVLVGADDL